MADCLGRERYISMGSKALNHTVTTLITISLATWTLTCSSFSLADLCTSCRKFVLLPNSFSVERLELSLYTTYCQFVIRRSSASKKCTIYVSGRTAYNMLMTSHVDIFQLDWRGYWKDLVLCTEVVEKVF